jgi:HEAT repeat protein
MTSDYVWNNTVQKVRFPSSKNILFLLLVFCLMSCAPKRVWYQEEVSASRARADVEECISNSEDQDRFALCMQAKGYLKVPQAQAELLTVKSLQEEGLDAEHIAQRLGLNERKVLRYLDEDYELPATASLGHQPTEISTKIGKPAVRSLIHDLKEEDPLVRSNAVRALGAIQDPRAVKPLIKVLNERNPLIQRQAVEALGRIDDARAVEPLVKVLLDKGRKPHVRLSAADALGQLGDPTAVHPLIEVLQDDHWEVRSYAAEALGRIRDPRAVEQLIAALNDQDASVRGNAVDALAKIKDPRALEPLTQVLTDRNRVVRQKAARALTAIAGEDFGVH